MPTSKKKSAAKKQAAPKKTSPSKPKSVLLAFTVDCLGCMAPIVADAVRSELRCRACLGTIDAKKILWASAAKSEVADALSGNADRATHFDHEGTTVVARARLEAPSCEQCAEELDVDPERDSCTCKCGASIPVRAADALLKSVHKNAIAVVGERPNADITPVEPVAFRCGCGAHLATDGTRRSLPCETCKAHVDVPEGLWNALFPVRRHPAMYLLVGGGR